MKVVFKFCSWAFAVACFFGSYSNASADITLDPNDPSWELQKDEDNIQVYFKDVAGSDIKAFMGKTVMSASLSSILKVMKDENTCADWVQGCVSAKPLEGQTFNHALQYGINDLPWPADDRDYVNQVSIVDDIQTGGIKVSLEAVQGHVPVTDNVRLEKMTIRYFLSPVSETETSVVWVQHTEPSGHIPDWLVNMLLIDIPFYSLTRLERVANRPEYRTAKFLYGEDGKILGFE
ncbi:START domain-containing protein [Alkalimarinus sediminis]|uniref:START domain-containing protein n=1 Tax=Alkalimarinus sediminis TaxID=1632866 RepID=A0A9E8KR85_9ALTE|nr:START domain-containing protein [Alkalimarinus sediminis]UZW75757.1 START domain-containing protein [Alkalimarinus sediminis]